MLLRTLVIALFLSSGFAGPAFAEPDLPKARQDRILLKFKAGQVPNDNFRAGGQILRTFPALGLEVIQLDGSKTAEEVLSIYRADPRVLYAQPDYLRSKSVIPNDPKLNDQENDPWHLSNDGRELGRLRADIAAPEAWDIRHDAEDVVVAVLDTGIRYTHEDLAPNMWKNAGEVGGEDGVDDDQNGFIDDVYGANLVDTTGIPMDDEGHGTFIAGLIGAVGNNGKGLAGVCWKVKLMAVKVLNARGFGSDSDIIAGLEYARQHGAKVINASLGRIGESNPALEDAIAALNSSGVLLVAAAGNASFNVDFDQEVTAQPASSPHPNVLSVAATTRNDLLALFSNHGWRSVDLGAPGVDVPSTSYESDTAYEVASGTSISAPLVSGALALMTAHLPELTHLQRVTRLLNAVDPVPSLSGKCFSGGRLNIRRALDGGSAAPGNSTASRALLLGNDIFFSGSTVSGGGNKTYSWTWTAPYYGGVNLVLQNDSQRGSGSSLVTVRRGSEIVASGSDGVISFNALYRETYQIVVSTTPSSGPAAFHGRYALAPEGYGDFAILAVNSSGPGTVGPRALLGQTIQRRGRRIKLIANPAPGYILYGWVDPAIPDLDDAVLSREPVYTFTVPDRGITSVHAVFVYNPFRDLEGKYNGLLTPEDGTSSPGFMSVNLAVTGAFSGNFRIGAQVYRFKGILRSDQEFTKVITTRGRAPLTLTFKLDDERRITGTVAGGATPYSVLAEAGHFDRFDNPNLSAGRYNVLLPTADPSEGQPGGAGFGFLTISPLGNVRFTGILGDGIRITQGATLYRTGHWPVFALPYKQGGFIAGTATFDESKPDSDLTGTLRWTKVARGSDRMYPAGFKNVVVQLTGSRFERSADGLLGNKALTISGVGITSKEVAIPPTVSTSFQSSEGVTITLSPDSGEFAGSFRESGVLLRFRGMISQKSGLGLGHVIARRQTGLIRLARPIE